MRGLFGRGAFTAADAAGGRRDAAAYAIGLVPFVLLRSVYGDVLCARRHRDAGQGAVLFGDRVNVALKLLLMGDFAQVGLAFATWSAPGSISSLVVWFAHRARLIAFDERLKRSVGNLAIAGLALAAALFVGARGFERPCLRRCRHCAPRRRWWRSRSSARLVYGGALSAAARPRMARRVPPAARRC